MLIQGVISILVVFVVVLIMWYFQSVNKVNAMSTRVQSDLNAMVDKINVQGTNIYTTDLEQSDMLEKNKKELSEIASRETLHIADLDQQFMSLHYIESENVNSLLSNINSIKTTRENSIENVQEQVSGIQSKFTVIGTNINTLTDKIQEMPIDQQIAEINNVQHSVSGLFQYATVNDETIASFESSLIENNVATNVILSEISDLGSSYVNQFDLNSYKDGLFGTLVNIHTLSNYATIKNAEETYAPLQSFNSLGNNVLQNEKHLAQLYAITKDLRDLVSSDSLSIYAPSNMLAGLSKQSDMLPYVSYLNYSANLSDLNKRMDAINATLLNMPASYGTKKEIDGMRVLIENISKSVDVSRAQANGVLANYVTKTALDTASISQYESGQVGHDTIAKIQSTIDNLHSMTHQYPQTFLKQSDAALKYTSLTSTGALENVVKTLPTTNTLSGMKVSMQSFFTPIVHVQDVQTAIAKIGDVNGTYATKQDLENLKAKILARKQAKAGNAKQAKAVVAVTTPQSVIGSSSDLIYNTNNGTICNRLSGNCFINGNPTSPMTSFSPTEKNWVSLVRQVPPSLLSAGSLQLLQKANLERDMVENGGKEQGGGEVYCNYQGECWDANAHIVKQ